MKNIMLDLETMGQGNNAAIVSIGAVYFDEYGTGDTFYRVVDLEDSVRQGMEIDPSTVLWWMKQSDEAREVFHEEGDTLDAVLNELSMFINKDCSIWGNGSDFDNVILANAYKKAGYDTPPWKFWNNRCYRTMKNMYRDVKMERSGTYHNALDDAISQAKHLIDIIEEKEISL